MMVSKFIVCSIISVVIHFASAENQCQTPNGLSGNCIPLQQCTSLYSLISSSITTANRKLLQNSKCGHTEVPYVCCPPDQQYNPPRQLPSVSRSQFESNPSTQLKASDLPKPGVCGTQTKERIVGGEETSIVDYPWMALIHYKKSGVAKGFSCGGSLINKNYVVTAAHCIQAARLVRDGFVPDYVRLGEHDLRSDKDCEEGECADPVVDVLTSEFTVHENYDPNSNYNDIALIRLARDVSFTDFVRPICLPFPQNVRNLNFDNSPLVVAGFGRTERGSPSEVKLKLEVKGFNLQSCNNIYNQIYRVSLNSRQMCAGGEDGKDSCNGDSGGPLMGEDISNSLNPYSYLAGIVSFGPRVCGTADVPGVYTRVDQYLDWIVSHIRS